LKVVFFYLCLFVSISGKKSFTHRPQHDEYRRKYRISLRRRELVLRAFWSTQSATGVGRPKIAAGKSTLTLPSMESGKTRPHFCLAVLISCAELKINVTERGYKIIKRQK